jgi:folate-dependent phosphoribosylglycinamide formyltransferase PurN
MPKEKPDLKDGHHRTPLRVVVLYSSGHLGSAMLFNRLLDVVEIEIIGLMKTKPLELTFRGRSKLKSHLKKLGWRFAWLLFWQRCIQSLGYLATMLLPFLRRRLRPAWRIAVDQHIPVFHCKNINDNSSLQFIAGLQPDLLISAYFSQILKKEIISVPQRGVLNVHPGWLPAYKGAMAYFWVLKEGSDRGGVSVHWIDEGIDTGKVLARRSFLIQTQATQERVLIFTAVIGARLIKRVVKKLAAGEELQGLAIAEQEQDTYYSMPGEEDFRSYFRERRFFRIRDVLGLLIFRRYR